MARSKRKQKQSSRLLPLGISLTVLVVGMLLYASTKTVAVLQPAGPIADGQRQLLIVASLLMLLVVLPVFGLTFWIVRRYRDTNDVKDYDPDWDHNKWLEAIWWLVPGALITVLAVLTWRGTFALDPYKPIASSQKTMTVQVVALNWRWLFIYPEQQVASINELYLPTNRPVKFMITSDAPMNSFWIPRLGGQIYAMPGMSSTLHLQANKAGTYDGLSANLSGQGFSKMRFKAIATDQASFSTWVSTTKTAPVLNQAAYAKLVPNTEDTKTYTFSRPDRDLYSNVVKKYMTHEHDDMPAIDYPETH